MNQLEKPAYLLSTSDMIRIRELLSMFQVTLERIFERTEIPLGAYPDELMHDMEFYARSTLGWEVDGDL